MSRIPSRVKRAVRRRWLGRSIITIAEMCAMLHVSRSTLWRIRTKDETFPKPIKLSTGGNSKILRWDRRAFMDWLESRMEPA